MEKGRLERKSTSSDKSGYHQLRERGLQASLLNKKGRLVQEDIKRDSNGGGVFMRKKGRTGGRGGEKTHISGYLNTKGKS